MNNAIELLPTRSLFAAAEPVRVELRGAAQGELRVLRLGDVVRRVDVAHAGVVELGELPPHGYGVELWDDDVLLGRTAVQVAADVDAYCRYGFVADYHPDRDVQGVADNIRRLHLTDVQFYDWAYRHADLLGGGEVYADALGQPVSVKTVQQLIAAAHDAGSRALGYAAVYAVGNDEWPLWQDLAILTASGREYGLGDFLSVVDPADERWLKHFTADLRAATAEIGFDGYHLDQYGDPKLALRRDGAVVDVAESFATMLEHVRDALPNERLVFNNVNDFPTWRTATCPIDVVYIEPWAPSTTLGHLARLARDARTVGGGKPVVFAAYQHVYDTAPTRAADLATSFTMATLFSHGATQLLCGEADRILLDPYYVRNHVVEESTAALLRRWYDFLVEHVELLQPDRAIDVTAAMAGDYNGDCDVVYQGAIVAEQPGPSTVWRRVLQLDGKLVVHLINFMGQLNVEWDAERNPPVVVAHGVLRMRRVGPNLPRIRIADPDQQPHLVELEVRADGDHVTAVLPPLSVWQMLVIDL